MESSDETYEVDKIVSVGEYLVVFVKEPAQTAESSSQENKSIPVLVLKAGEDGALIANTGEGERLVFSKMQAGQQ